jgi:hypothetical protein
VVDHYTGAIMLHPCESDSAESVAFALVNQWIPHHGIPEQLITDRGKGFKSTANKAVFKMLNINKIFTSAYHPQTNAKAERVVQEMKKSLRLININLDEQFTKKTTDLNVMNALKKEIVLLLPSIQFALNQRVHSITQVSPHMMLYGKNLREFVDFSKANQQLDIIEKSEFGTSKYQLVNQLRAQLKLVHDRHANKNEKYLIDLKIKYDLDKSEDNFVVGDLVVYYIGDRASNNKKLQRRLSGPWKVLERVRHNVLRIKNESNDDELACHVGMLRKYVRGEFTPAIEKIITETGIKNTKRKKQ